MIRLAIVLILLGLAGCAHAPPMNCQSAQVVRATAELTIRGLDRVCPIASGF